MPNLNDYHNYKNSGGGSNNGGGSGCDLDRKKKRCIIYTIGFVYPFDVFKL